VNETSDQQLATEAPEDGKFSAYVEACHAKNVEVFEFVWENRALMAMVLEGGGSSSYGHLIEDFAHRSQRQTAALIQHGVDIGLYRTDLDIEAAAAFIAGGFDRIARTLVRAERKPDIDELLRQAQWLFLGGIARREALVGLDRDQQKLSGQRAVERGESHAGGGVGPV
jgi:hypothetical protein